MATAAQVKAFIEKIAPCAQGAFKTFGKVKPSVCIAMACVESGYGTAGSCKHYSFLGQKVGTGKTATKYWDGKFFSSKTGEEYTLGVHTTITAAFRSYDSMQQCVNNYYELLNTSLYGRVLAESDYKSQMQQIKSVGYMTSSTEVNSVLSIISKYNLTQYDQLSTSAVSSVTVDAPAYKVGKNYTLLANMFVRNAANGDKMKFEKLTSNAQKNAISDGGFGVLKKGTVVTVQQISTVNSATWIRIPSGWVCAVGVDKRVYVK